MFCPHQIGMVKQVEILADWPDWKVEIAEALNAKGLSMKVASLRSGLNETFVRDMLKREKKPMHDNLQRIREILGLVAPIERAVNDGLPVVGITEAGNWRDVALSAPRKDIPDTIPVAADRRYGHASQYALLVSGDSMDRIIADGSFVTCAAFADTGLEYRAGMILHVERHQGPLVETTIKRYAEIKGKRWLLPESNNPSHKPIEINGGEDTEIFVKGLVLGTWTPINY